MKIKLIHILIIVLIIEALVIGVILGAKLNEEGKIYVGCWKEVFETNRSITIRVDGLSIDENLDTARHEMCHEIYYRRNNNTFIENETNEDFAEECNPEDWLYLDEETK